MGNELARQIQTQIQALPQDLVQDLHCQFQDSTLNCCTAGNSTGSVASLGPGDRRWVPEGLRQSQLYCQLDVGESWGRVEIACVLVGAGGVVLGLIGSRGIAKASGVSTDYVNGEEVFRVCLSKLSRNVHGVVLLAMPIGLRSTVELSNNKPGSGYAYLCRSTRNEGEPVGENSEHRLTKIVRLRLQLPPRSHNNAAVVLAFHSAIDENEPWHFEAICRNTRLQAPQLSLAAVANTIAQLSSAANAAIRGWGRSKPEGSLPAPPGVYPTDDLLGSDLSFKYGAVHADLLSPRGPNERVDVADELATAHRLAEERRSEAQQDQNRVAALRKALSSAQEQFRKVSRAMQTKQYELEAWQREALIRAQAGDSARVVAMLDKLPSPLYINSLDANKDTYRKEILSAEALMAEFIVPSPRPNQKAGVPARQQSVTSAGDPMDSVASRGTSVAGTEDGAKRGSAFNVTRHLLPDDAGYLLPAHEREWGQEQRGTPRGPVDTSASNAAENEVFLHFPRDRDPRKPDARDGHGFDMKHSAAKPRQFSPRAGDPLVSRPSSAVVGDVPLSALPLEDVEDWQPFRELFQKATDTADARADSRAAGSSGPKWALKRGSLNTALARDGSHAGEDLHDGTSPPLTARSTSSQMSRRSSLPPPISASGLASTAATPPLSARSASQQAARSMQQGHPPGQARRGAEQLASPRPESIAESAPHTELPDAPAGELEQGARAEPPAEPPAPGNPDPEPQSETQTSEPQSEPITDGEAAEQSKHGTAEAGDDPSPDEQPPMTPRQTAGPQAGPPPPSAPRPSKGGTGNSSRWRPSVRGWGRRTSSPQVTAKR